MGVSLWQAQREPITQVTSPELGEIPIRVTTQSHNIKTERQNHNLHHTQPTQHPPTHLHTTQNTTSVAIIAQVGSISPAQSSGATERVLWCPPSNPEFSWLTSWLAPPRGRSVGPGTCFSGVDSRHRHSWLCYGNASCPIPQPMCRDFFHVFLCSKG